VNDCQTCGKPTYGSECYLCWFERFIGYDDPARLLAQAKSFAKSAREAKERGRQREYRIWFKEAKRLLGIVKVRHG